MNNCIICGSPLLKVKWTGEAYCPNHGIVPENQEPKRFDPNEEEEK